jgi:tagatose 1,6-diphosphate aldolase
MTLADGRGLFKMIAVDQRPPIFQALAQASGRPVSEVTYDEVANVKALLCKVLAPEASAMLLDPVWAHPRALMAVPGRTGLLSTLEDYSFELHEGERCSAPIQGWSVAKIKRSGAAGVKALVWYRPDASAVTLEHQDAFVRAAGEACREHDIPFVLEIIVYPKEGEDGASAEFAKAKPERVLAGARHYADEQFGVDVLKLEFPANLKYCREFAAGAFDEQAREPLCSLSDVEGFLREMHAATNVPWVMLSAGVGPREFAVNLELAFAAGASGFLAGRAVWLEALARYPDMAAVEAELRAVSVPYLRQISGLADGGLPWTDHPRYGGEVGLAGAGESWYREYSA